MLDTFSYELFDVVFPIPTLSCGVGEDHVFPRCTLCTTSYSALYKLPTLAVSGRDLPTRSIVCLVVWFLLKLQPPSWLRGSATAPSSSTVCNTAPTFLAKTSPLCVRTLLTSVYIMDSSSRKGHLLCWALFRLSLSWTDSAPNGCWPCLKCKEEGGCDTQAEWWFAKVGVVI